MKPKIKLAVVGTRHYNNKNAVYYALNDLRKVYDITEIISGVGKDQKTGPWPDIYGRDYALENKIKYVGFVPDWTDMAEPCVVRRGFNGPYNAMAGPKRNTLIAERATYLLAFWNGISQGTYDTISKFSNPQIIRI